MEMRMSDIVNGALKHFNSRYELVRVSALRVNSLIKGDKILLDPKKVDSHKAATIALLEMQEGLWERK